MDTLKSVSALRSLVALAGWLALTFAAATTGAFVSTGGLYAALVKPSWHPPAWVFGPVWTVLYAMTAVAAWLVWRQGGWAAQKGALRLYLAQWALNALWTPIFFGLRQPGWALVEIVALDAAVLATLAVFWRVSRPAGWLFVPYALWVLFATVLNFAIWRLNTGGGA